MASFDLDSYFTRPLQFVNDDDAEVFGLCIFDEDEMYPTQSEYNLVDLDYIPTELVLDSNLRGHIPVRLENGSICLRYGRFYCAGSNLIDLF